MKSRFRLLPIGRSNSSAALICLSFFAAAALCSSLFPDAQFSFSNFNKSGLLSIILALFVFGALGKLWMMLLETGAFDNNEEWLQRKADDEEEELLKKIDLWGYIAGKANFSPISYRDQTGISDLIESDAFRNMSFLDGWDRGHREYKRKINSNNEKR